MSILYFIEDQQGNRLVSTGFLSAVLAANAANELYQFKADQIVIRARVS